MQLEWLGCADRQAGAEEAEWEGALEEGEGEEEGHGDTGGEEGQAALQETAQTNEAKVSQNRLKNITFFLFLSKYNTFVHIKCLKTRVNWP